jgi:tetratricopeptide (TPR) repeat protein
MDARNYVDELLQKKQTTGQIPRYDFIYEDAFNDYSVPYQLTTKEFNDKIAQILTDDGVYIMNLIDTFDNGLFLGTIIKTLEQTFPHIYVIAKDKAHRAPWGTFVVVAAMREINLENLASEKPVAGLNLWILNDSETETFVKKGRGIVLTDDYAPVENMLTPVVRQSAVNLLLEKYLEQVLTLQSQGKLDECLAIYKELIKADPTMSIMAYNNMGQILARQGKWQEAIDAAKSAIEYNEKAKVKVSMPGIYYSIGLLLKKLGRNTEASEYLYKAIKDYRENLAQKPDSTRTLISLANALLEVDRFDEATKYLQQAVDMNPSEVGSHLALANVLLKQQRYDEAITVIKKAIASFSSTGNEKTVADLQKYLEFVEYNKKANKK